VREIVFPEFPYYLKIFEYIEDDVVKVVIHSKIHKNKEVKMPDSWSMKYRTRYPKSFMDDVFYYVIKRYGLTKVPTQYI
jgi:hypothetical protein